MNTLWDAAEAAAATGGEAPGEWQAARVAIDSRRIQPGDLFVALRGENFDGHAFAAHALENGAAAAMVEKGAEPEGVAAEKLLVVDDCLAALNRLAAHARARAKAKIVGVTGSVGKTSTKDMLRLALSAHGETFASHGNFNNHIGAPLNLANLPPAAPFAVFEMGMNHAGEISPLTRLIRPHVAVITNVEPVHLEFFASVEAIADAKCEIFEGLEPGGTILLNADNAQFDRCRKAAGSRRVRSFGRSGEADIRLLDCRIESGATLARVGLNGREYAVRLGALGEHFAYAALIALGAAEAFGLDIEKTIAALSAFREPEGRGGIAELPLPAGSCFLVDDSYNASPASMRAAFAKTRAFASDNPRASRVVAALGEMRELGPSAPKLHAGLAESLTEQGFDAVFVAGPLMKNLYDALPPSLRAGEADSAEALLPMLREALAPGDVLLVKGSHGSHMYRLASALREKAHA